MDWARQFEQTWKAHGSADVFAFLSTCAGATLSERTNVLLVEQRLRHATGNPRNVTDYFRFAPDIDSSPVHKIELLVAEYTLLQSGQQAPNPREFCDQFADVSDALLQQLTRRSDGSEPTIDYRTTDTAPNGRGAVNEPPSGKTITNKAKVHRSKTIDVPERAMAKEAPFGATVDMPGDTGKTPNDSPALPANMRIDRYLILQVLGEGGFGRVYLANDEELQRHVALKVPHEYRIESATARNEYFAEARIVAKLDHTNIVPVYDVGQLEDGLCYIVSKRIEGSTLATYVRDMDCSHIDIANIISQVADALHYAHLQGLVHRDIKPSNILVDAAGMPVLIDFGLALKEEDFGTGNTFLGTPSYMSPEQARGEGHLADGRSDIFSLGTVMYVMLTGSKPFKGKTIDETTSLVMRKDPIPLRVLERTIPRELERICLRSLEKRAVDRYQTAMDMAEDLRIFVQNNLTASAAAPSQNVQSLERSTTTTSVAGTKVVSVVPKGLRSFDGTDADFFLALLPGAKDRDGLPNSVRFWKTLIAERDRNQTFRIGLIYGPSGCGKSSLVQAGLLPRLDQDIIPIYVESTGGETETRILNGIRKRCPNLGPEHDICAAMSLIRRGRVVPTGQKVVLILDQFEQWLHANGESENPELVRALRQCDAENLQCILMVRDDFWLAASRLMRELEVDQMEGRNMATVDLFDKLHSRKVMSAFGRAHGRLPESSADLTKEQNRFLDDAVDGLAEDGKIIPVRIALFAEMIKGKEWKPATLTKLGGTQGVGVTFLEETFSSSTSPPAHRLHENAVRLVLHALLPEEGTDIKGHMQSYDDLLRVSGYEHRPEDFRHLLALLDNQLRLVTPTDPVGAAMSEDSLNQISGQNRWYQLTHDYLVPSLREWLTNHQKETLRGRAELKLREQASLWNAKPERRRLPSSIDWLAISSLTQRRNWTDSQRRMMRVATRTYLAWTAVWMSVIASFVGVILYSRGWNRGEVLRERLLAVETRELLPTIEAMEPYRHWIDPALRQTLEETSPDSESHFRAGLALLPVDDSPLDSIKQRGAKASIESTLVIRDLLNERHRAELTPWLWGQLQNVDNPPAARRNAAIILATYDPPNSATNERWTPHADFLAEQLIETVLEHPDDYASIRGGLRSVRHNILESLHPTFVEDIPDRSRKNAATSISLDFAKGDPAALTALLIDANTRQFLQLYPLIKPQIDEIASRMHEILAKQLVEPITESARQSLSRHKGNAAVTLLRLGRAEDVKTLWPFLKDFSDPHIRSCLVNLPFQRDVDIDILLDRFDRETDIAATRALMLALGDYPFESLSAERQVSMQQRLYEMSTEHPDAGIHAAARWLLTNWKCDATLQASEKILKTTLPSTNRNWYVTQGKKTRNAFTMARIDGRQNSLIGRVYEIATTEVSLKQYYDSRTNDDHHFNIERHPDMNCPVSVINWFEAVKYCQWLSEHEGVPEDQWCYPSLEKLEAAIIHQQPNLMAMLQPDLTRTGYRLPTAAEWSHACRAGTTTQWAFGHDDQFLPQYAWCGKNSLLRSWPGGLRKPNDFGVFDMYGNVAEWMAEFGYGSDEYVERQGGSFFDTKHSGFKRGYVTPHDVKDSCGMRVTRTAMEQ